MFGGAGQTLTLPVTFYYGTSGSNATFIKNSSYILTISTTPLSVSIDSLTETVSGKPLTFTLTVSSNATIPLDNVVLTGAFPFGFSVTSSSHPLNNSERSARHPCTGGPFESNNYWNIDRTRQRATSLSLHRWYCQVCTRPDTCGHVYDTRHVNYHHRTIYNDDTCTQRRHIANHRISTERFTKMFLFLIPIHFQRALRMQSLW